jgi:Mrp family chromosome partitioning ATPase
MIADGYTRHMDPLLATSEVRPGLSARTLRRHVPAIVLCMLLGAVLGAAYGELRPERYTAEAQVLLARPASDAVLGTGATASDSARYAANEFQVLSSESLLRAAEERAGYPLDVELNAVEGSDIADVSATATSALKAASDANGYAATYVDLRDRQQRAVLDAATAALERRLDETQDTLNDIDAELARAGAQRNAVAARLGPTRDSLLRQQSEIRDRLEDLALRASIADSGARITAAVAPTSSSSLSPGLSAVLGLLLGGLIAAGLAVLLERRRGRVVDADDVRRVGLDGLDGAHIVSIGSRRSPATSAAPDDDPAHVAAYRQVAAVLGAEGRGLDRTVVGVFPVGWVTAGGLAGNLALSMSTLGRRVVVVDCAAGTPTLDRFFAAPSEPGLTDVLAGQATLDTALTTVRTERLALLPSGSGYRPLVAADVAGVLSDLAALGDTVILALPDPGNSATALLLAAECTLSVLAVEKGVAQKDLRAAADALRRVDLPASAVVLLTSGRGDRETALRAEPHLDAVVAQTDPVHRSRPDVGPGRAARSASAPPVVAASPDATPEEVARVSALLERSWPDAVQVRDEPLAAVPAAAPDVADLRDPVVTPPARPAAAHNGGLSRISPAAEPIAAAASVAAAASLSRPQPQEHIAYGQPLGDQPTPGQRADGPPIPADAPAEPAAETAVEPAAEPSAEPAAEPSVEPAAETPAELDGQVPDGDLVGEPAVHREPRVPTGAVAGVEPSSIAGPISAVVQRVLAAPRTWGGGSVPSVTVPERSVSGSDPDQ